MSHIKRTVYVVAKSAREVEGKVRAWSEEQHDDPDRPMPILYISEPRQPYMVIGLKWPEALFEVDVIWGEP